jgi:amino acid transporter
LHEEQAHLPRVLGLAGLSFLLIAALVNINSVPVVAAMGPGALVFWILGFLLFLLPQGAAVVELSSRYPQEGGIYNWSKTAFGDFHGFISGWCYWTNNIFYIPTLLFYIVGFAAFVGGETTRSLGSEPLFMVGISLGLLWLITWLNIFGLRFGSWVQGIGVVGTFLTTLILVGVGFAAASMRGVANPIEMESVVGTLGHWRTISLLSIVCLNYVGLELGSVLGDEIRTPRRTIPRALLVAGVSTVGLYLLATLALQASVPASEIGVIDGILQGVKVASADLGVPWILPLLAVLMSLNASGNASAWLAGAARIPFVIGIDRYLPAAFARVHSRYHTPHVALIVQGFASSLFIVISAVGASVSDMYLILLQTTVILQLIPYLYMFGALVRIRRSPERFAPGRPFFKRSWIPYGAGTLGAVVTLAGLGLAFVPAAGVDDVLGFEMKTVLGVLSFLVPAVVLYRRKARRLRAGDPIGTPLEVISDP